MEYLQNAQKVYKVGASMVSTLVVIGKFILEYFVAPIVLGFIVTAAQFKTNINSPSRFPLVSNKKLLLEMIIFSLIFLILHVIISLLLGELFLYDLW